MNELQQSHNAPSTIAPTVENLRKYLSVPEKKTDNELALDLELARQRGLNPFTGEMYYAQDGKLALTKAGETILASRNENFQPPTAGVVVIDKNDDIIQRVGTATAPQDKIIGGWARIDSLGYENTVSFLEYYNGAYVLGENGKKTTDVHGKIKKRSKANGEALKENLWDKKPGTMIRKVAVIHALREAFPQSYAGLYSDEEAGFLGNQEQSTQPKPKVQKQPRQEAKQAEIIEEF